MAAFILGLGCPSFDGAPIPIDFQSEKKGKRIELTIGSLSSALLVPACGAVAARAEKSSGDGWELDNNCPIQSCSDRQSIEREKYNKKKKKMQWFLGGCGWKSNAAAKRCHGYAPLAMAAFSGGCGCHLAAAADTKRTDGRTDGREGGGMEGENELTCRQRRPGRRIPSL